MHRVIFVWVYGLLVIACISCAAPTVTPVPMLIPAPMLPIWEKDYPLAMGNVWIYHALRYDGFNPDDIMTVGSVITQTVVEVNDVPPYWVAKIHQESSAEMPVYVPPSMRDIAPKAAESSEYWLVVNDNRIYRQERNLDLSNLSDSTVELVFPLTLGSNWYLADEMEKLDPSHTQYSMLRQVTRVGTITAPAGSFDNCFFMEETIGGGTFEDWFCSGVGWVDRKDDHHGTPFGSRWSLIKYQVK